jgi:hypothetical protein
MRCVICFVAMQQARANDRAIASLESGEIERD